MREISKWIRLSGTADERSAFEYIDTVLREGGVETRLLTHPAYISLPRSARLVLADGTALPCVTHAFVPSTGSRGVTGRLVDAGSAVRLRADPAGAIAIVDGLAMTSNVRAVERAGAIGQIHVNARLTYEMIPTSGWGSPGIGAEQHYPSTPVVSVTGDTGTELRRRLARGDAQVTLVTETETRWRQIPLLVADVRAPGSDDFVLFSGHVDSWHHGAMDNASGNAVMIEVARHLAANQRRLARGVRFCFWSGHSHGRYAGSAWYADNHWSDLRRHCVVHVNIDSVGGAGASVLSAGIAMAATRAIAKEAIAAETGVTFEGSRVGRAGDQSFVAMGIPSLWMTLSEQPPSDDITARVLGHLVGGEVKSGGLGWWWHTVEDTVDRIDPDNLVRDARIYARAIERLAYGAQPGLDVTAEAHELAAMISDLADMAGEAFDLSGPLRAARQVESASAIGIASESDQRLALHELIQLNYSIAGPYAQDPADSVRPVPLLAAVTEMVVGGLDDEGRNRLLVDLTRARNRVEDRLEVALQHLTAVHSGTDA